MMQRINCLVHGNFTTERAPNGYCPRCADMERKSITDLKTEESKTAFIREEQLEVEACYKSLVEDVRGTWNTIPEGRKDDKDKPDLSLLPREALEAMAYAFMHGEKKYGRYNFLSGMDWHRPIAAAYRHLVAFNSGEDIDSESGISHLGHAMAAIAMVSVYQSKKLGKDTRHKP